MSSRPYYGAIRVTNNDDDYDDESANDAVGAAAVGIDRHGEQGNLQATASANLNDGERAPLLQQTSDAHSSKVEFSATTTTTAAAAAKESIGMHQQINDDIHQTSSSSASSLAAEFKLQLSKVRNLLGAYWTSITFDWISPLIQTGNANGQLNLQDLETLPLPKDCETNEVYAVFSKCWKAELDKAKKTNIGGSSNGDEGKKVDDAPPTDETQSSDPKDKDLLMDGLLDLDDNYDKYQPSLIRALYNAFGADFLNAGLLKLVHDSCLFVGPQVLNRLIRFLRDENAPMSYGLSLMVLVTLSQIAMSISLRHYFYKCYTCGLRIRTAVIIAIYNKSLVLSLKERHAHGGPGEIANLVGIDAQRMQELMTYLHAVWYSFFQIGLAMYFLWGQVGPSCLAGVVVIALMIPITKVVAAWLGRIQKVLMKARDDRVSLNNEILGAMKIIKIQAWEEDFRAKLLQLRDQELSRLRHYFVTSAISITSYSSAPLIVAVSTFAAYTFAGNTLDVATALTALALFDIIRFPMFMFPQIVNSIVEAGISCERVREFLLGEEVVCVGEGQLKEKGEVWMKNGTFVYDSKKPQLPTGGGEAGATGNESGIRGLMQQHHRMMMEANLDTSWDMLLLKAQLKDAEDKLKELEQELHPEILRDESNQTDQEGPWSPSSLLSLRRVTMHCGRGEFVAVVGGVGAGKSTLINSILGEGRPLTGTELAVKGRLGAFLQTPFIMNETVRQNILFGHTSPIDEERYQLALRVCSLSHDMKLLPHGDQTEIGEKGITLSGGQKARVALARAVYHDADLYLLDDPLAAVDAHVGKDLFNKCVVDELLLGKSKEKDRKPDEEQAYGGIRGFSERLLGRSPSKLGSDDTRPNRNATVILVTNALHHLSHPLVDKILVLDNGCVAEVGTYTELSSNPKSRFTAFLKTITDTSTAMIGGVPSDEGATNAEDWDVASGDPVDYGGDEQEVDKLVRVEPRRVSNIMISSSRRISNSVREDEANDSRALMTDEFNEREKGSVDRRVYLAWARAGGGISVGIVILGMYVAVEVLNVASKWWLTYWSRTGGSDAFYFLGIYAFINFLAIFGTFCRQILFMLVGLRASRSMFEQLLDVVLNAPMAFFDTTPTGRIINRFSKDLYTVDEQVVAAGRSYLANIVNVFSTVIVVMAVTPMFIIGLVPIMLYYVHQQRFFTMTYRELKRLDSVCRSPIYALLGETLDGVLTIRAFEAEKSLSDRMVGMLNTQQTAYHLTFSSQSWLSLRLEFAGTLIIASACLLAVLEHPALGGNEHFAGLAGLSLSFALSITNTLNWTVRMASDLEANFVAVERIQQYFNIPGEAPRSTLSDGLAMNWPMEGRIEFINVTLKYRPGLPLVLKGLNISIPAKSKVGVVGRTGAGKSTLMVALLRIVELNSGSITIDGIDIKSLGLKKLRSVIAVIPQDPVLFSGTIRSNLDPFGDYEDSRLYEVLTQVGLFTQMVTVSSKVSLSSLGNEKWTSGRSQPIKSLSDEVSVGGNNFSVGQRQLLVIARAMLTGARIVIMDEATASVDADTDARIQRVFRSEFSDATCITVAHRLNTIMDSDYVLVMDDGQAAEFDKPSALLSKENGIFKSLVDAWEDEN